VSAADALRARVRDALATLDGSRTLLVALSGGMDSCVLLHLLRFGVAEGRPDVLAAHFDHRMRPSSVDDARWVAGLCRAWNVPVRIGRAEVALSSEEEGRDARYRFLEEARRETGADLVLTAHHADDQAETVLFRLFRGAGGRGLSGIPAHRSPFVRRPLLDFWRSDLEEYAGRVHLSWREDPTNHGTTFARNALRNRILPDVERLVSPGARRALVRLADIASDEEAAWASVLPTLMEPLGVLEVEGGVSFGRAPFLEMHPGVRARVLRALADGLDASLDHGATRRAVAFVETAVSGRALELAGRLTFGVDLDRCVLARSAAATGEQPLTIAGVGPGRGTAVLAGTEIPVVWGAPAETSHPAARGFDPEALRFPLLVRSRRPGDRIRLPGGTKKVKKVMLERRIPLADRHRLPLLVDAEGEVVWIPGLAAAEWAVEPGGACTMEIGIG